MFGYIKPVPAELKVREYELYRSVYCGLCTALGRNTTCVSRLTLSYDFVFLAIVRMALTGETGSLERRRCLAHPTKKRAVLTDAKQLDYCARVSSILTFNKLRDDINDERGAKRLSAGSLLPAAKLMRKKALPELSELDAFISDRLGAQRELEKKRVYSPDAAAEPFGELMAAVFSEGLDGGAERIASELGRHIGRFIYIADAADDLASDLKSGCYNPFRIEGKADDEILADFAAHKEELRSSLTFELIGVERAVELIRPGEVPEYLSIIKNIIYLGLPAQISRLIDKKEEPEAPERV